jgi:hypothetical protein
MIDDDAVKSKILLIFIASAIPKIIVPLAFMLVFIVPFVNIRRKVKKIHYLERYGALIRNIPYSMVKTNTVVNGVPIKRIAIEYTLRDGTKTILHSEKRLDHKLSDGDGKVDLLIDPNNESNYYIDFNIPLVDAPKIG